MHTMWHCIRSIWHIIKRPQYTVLFLGSTLLVSMVLVWFFNLELILHIVDNSVLEIDGKITFFFHTVGMIYADVLTSLRSFLFVLVSIVFGLNITVLAFLKRYHRTQSTPKSGFVVALVGSGCVACGGSILAPILVFMGATASVALSHFINITAFVLAAVLAFYSLYTLISRNKGVFM